MTFPPAPWHTHGRAFVQPYLVEAAQLRLPAGFRPVTIAGRAVGMLGLIEYAPPSPLVYAELVWMPCVVTAGGKRGYFVDRMYVDSVAACAGGREIWALPKRTARFVIGEHEATVDTDDGAHLELALKRRRPMVRAATGAGTLQDDGAEIVRFRSSGSARVGSGRLEVRSARGTDDWMGWGGARRLRGLGVALEDFAITMHAPQRLPRG